MDAMNPFEDDALDRELRAALKVDPSPEFTARVRLHIAKQRQSDVARYTLFLWLTALVGMAAIASIVVPRLYVDGDQPTGVARFTTLGRETVSNAPATRVSPAVVDTAPASRTAPRAGSERAVAVSRKDGEALDEYVRSIYAAPIQWTAFTVQQPWPDDWLVPLPEIPKIAVAPLVIEPLNPVAQ